MPSDSDTVTESPPARSTLNQNTPKSVPGNLTTSIWQDTQRAFLVLTLVALLFVAGGIAHILGRLVFTDAPMAVAMTTIWGGYLLYYLFAAIAAGVDSRVRTFRAQRRETTTTQPENSPPDKP